MIDEVKLKWKSTYIKIKFEVVLHLLEDQEKNDS